MTPTLLHAIRNTTIFAAGICAAGASYAQSYQFIDLGAGQANGINDSGVVVGESADYNAVMWTNGSRSYLFQDSISNPVGGVGGDATAINNAGQIIGYVTIHANMEGALWNPSSYATNFTTLTSSNGATPVPLGLNNKGGIVGQAEGIYALQWSANNPVANSLSAPNTYSLAAYAINDAGVVVGSAVNTNNVNLAVEWNNGVATYLPGAGSGGSGAGGINNAGTVVGWTSSGAQNSTAAEWKNGSFISLGGLGGNSSAAGSINNAGLIVGESTNAAGTELATLWRGTTAINLNTMLTPAEHAAGWTLTDATGINNNGWIVGDATNSKTGATDGFMLEVSPVPEADTWAMLLAGLGLIGACRYRKRGSLPGRPA